MDRLGTFSPHRHFKFNPLTVTEIIVGSFDMQVLDVDISAPIIRRDESKSFILVVPFDRSVWHKSLVLRSLIFDALARLNTTLFLGFGITRGSEGVNLLVLGELLIFHGVGCEYVLLPFAPRY